MDPIITFGSPAHAGMALRAPRADGAIHRFPRPRGDGPLHGGRRDGRQWVPPPTRGWPRTVAHLRIAAEGSPAHAGMAPRPSDRGTASWRFPRPRGDGPAGDGIEAGTGMVPPPTRGWPLPMNRGSRHPAGSPAHAGMARQYAGRSLTLFRFPRPRGDGPGLSNEYMGAMLVPPPTRGWLARARLAGFSAAGSPAHAGMAPQPEPGQGWRARFPRPRGDGPRSAPRWVWAT